MHVRQPLPPGAYHRSAVDHDLAVLFADLAAARVVNQLARRSRPPSGAVNRDQASGVRLVAALSAWTAALEQHRLPVPPTIRDELRLRQRLTARPARRYAVSKTRLPLRSSSVVAREA
jgi:hypothetical protein